jgi:hypothetical protein
MPVEYVASRLMIERGAVPACGKNGRQAGLFRRPDGQVRPMGGPARNRANYIGPIALFHD